MNRTAAALLLLFNPVLGYGADASSAITSVRPASSIRLSVDNVHITQLDCSRRKFAMQTTRTMGRWYKYMGKGMVGGEADPRMWLMAVISMGVMVPMTVLAVPYDLFSGPFRRECDFKAAFEGSLTEWAGRKAAGVPMGAEGRNVLGAGVPGVVEPTFTQSFASSSSDADGRFTITIDGHVADSKDFDIAWAVKDQEAGAIRIRKSGKDFHVYELEAGFGTGVYSSFEKTVRAE